MRAEGIALLAGLTLTDIQEGDNVLFFTSDDGRKFKMYHSQDCCEHVYIEDIVGDLSDLLHSPILLAEEISGELEEKKEGSDESYTWTFYKLATIKGNVTIRWYGTSNGYYSESVTFEEDV